MSLISQNLKNRDDSDKTMKFLKNNDESDETRSEYYDHEAIRLRGQKVDLTEKCRFSIKTVI